MYGHLIHDGAVTPGVVTPGHSKLSKSLIAMTPMQHQV